MRGWPIAVLASAVALDACTPSTGGGGGGGAGGSYAPYQEIYDAGLLRYVGTDAVQPVDVTHPILYAKLDVYHYGTDPTLGGPLCMRGDEFFVETRDGASDALMIFLEVGGVCTTEICAATVKPTISLQLLTTGDLIGIGGVLDKTDARNPMADYDLVHVPYCDGSIFTGDVDRILSDGDPSNGTQDPAYQRGLQNLTAAFEVAKGRFPNPSRVVLAGSSGGSYGSIAAVAMARYYYPDQPILAIMDSGAPILTDRDPGFVDRVLTELDARRYIPASCPGCIDNGHVTKVIEWALDRDANLSGAYLGHAEDYVIGEFYMGDTAEQHRTSTLRETGALVDDYPGRVHRFITPGSRHTYLLDVDYVPGSVQSAALYIFGPGLFTGPDVTASDVSKFILGGLREEGVDETGQTLSGYDWLQAVVDDPTHATNVVSY